MNNSFSIAGVIKSISKEEQVTDTFNKREFVIQTVEQYSQTICFELHKDRTDLIEPYGEGEHVEVSFNIRGKEWQKDSSSPSRVFHTLAAWKISRINQ